MSPPKTWISASVPVVVWGGDQQWSSGWPPSSSGFCRETSQVRSDQFQVQTCKDFFWVISLGKGSERNSSTESNQLSSRWITHITWASVVGFSQIEASILNLIYVNITYYLHKTLQRRASGYYNLSLCCLTPAITLEKIHFNTVRDEQSSPSSRRYFTCQSTSYTCYQQAQALSVQEKYFSNIKATGSSYRHYYLNKSDFRVTF